MSPAGLTLASIWLGARHDQTPSRSPAKWRRVTGSSCELPSMRSPRAICPMWPPTISTLMSLTAFDDVAAALAAAPTRIEAVTG